MVVGERRSVFDTRPCHEARFASSSHRELRALQSAVGNRELRDLIGAYLQRYPIRAADVTAGKYGVGNTRPCCTASRRSPTCGWSCRRRRTC